MAQVFSCGFCEIPENKLYYRTFRVAASENEIKKKKQQKRNILPVV